MEVIFVNFVVQCEPIYNFEEHFLDDFSHNFCFFFLRLHDSTFLEFMHVLIVGRKNIVNISKNITVNKLQE